MDYSQPSYSSPVIQSDKLLRLCWSFLIYVLQFTSKWHVEFIGIPVDRYGAEWLGHPVWREGRATRPYRVHPNTAIVKPISVGNLPVKCLHQTKNWPHTLLSGPVCNALLVPMYGWGTWQKWWFLIPTRATRPIIPNPRSATAHLAIPVTGITTARLEQKRPCETSSNAYALTYAEKLWG